MSLPFRTVRSAGVQSAIDRLKNPRALLTAAMVPQLQTLGVHLVGKIKPVTPADTTEMRSGNRWTVIPETLTLLIYNLKKYAIYVHHGTHHRRMPPVSALLEWARRGVVNARLTVAASFNRLAGATGAKKISMSKTATDADKSGAAELAFLVARSILRRGGLKPRPFMRDTIQAERAAIEAAVRRGEAAFVRSIGG